MPQSVGRKLTTSRAHHIRIRKAVGSIPIRSTVNGNYPSENCGDFSLSREITGSDGGGTP